MLSYNSLLARAGAQIEEPLADSIRSALSASIAQAAPPRPTFDNVDARMAYLRWLGAMADPLRVEEFHANREWIGKQGARVANIYSNAYKQTGRALNLPAEHMLVSRVCGGWMNILAQLDCTVRARAIATEWVPGFADPETPSDPLAAP